MASGFQMDQETALELVKKGATLLLLDVPQFTLFGIDTQMFTVGPLFRGIKMIPPGPHIVYYSPSNKEGNEFSPIVSFFITTDYSEVVVCRWHQQEERLIKVSEDEEGRYYEAVKRLEFDRQLGPYALDQFGEWKQLSIYITARTIQRIEPIGGEMTIAYESGLVDEVPKTIMEKSLMEQLRSSKFSKCSSEGSQKRKCYYTNIPQTVKDKNITGEELTLQNLDKTKLLETIILKDLDGEEDLLLGELQFAFVAFMMGQSLQAFVQWKALISLFLSCTVAPLQTRSQLFSKFIKVIYWQLKHGFHKGLKATAGVDKGILLSLDNAWFSKDNFLFRLCKDFFAVVLQAPVVDGDLLLWTRKLKQLLEATFGWDFEESIIMDAMCKDDDEFSPVFVPPEEAMPSQGPDSA